MLYYQFGGSSSSAKPRAPGGARVWRCLAMEKLSQVELRTGAWHTEPRSPRRTVLMRWISIPTFSLEMTRKKGNEATAATTDAPKRSNWWQSSADYVARDVRGDPRGR